MSDVLKRPNTENHYKITHKDLPLSCPSQKMRVWDSHPRVFLPIEETGEVNCPYWESRGHESRGQITLILDRYISDLRSPP